MDLQSVGFPTQSALENARKLSRVEKAMEECPSGIEECAEQQHSESIVEQIDTGSFGEQHMKFLE